MADTVRSLTAMLALMPTGTVGGVSAQDERDVAYSAIGVIPYVAKSANYTATEDDVVIDVTTGASTITITLPAVASTRVGKFYIIRKADSGGGAITIDGNASETLNGAATKSVSTQYRAIMIVNIGTAWTAWTLTEA